MKTYKVIEHNRYRRNAIIASLIAGIAALIAIHEKAKCDKCAGIELLADVFYRTKPDEMAIIFDACKEANHIKRSQSY